MHLQNFIRSSIVILLLVSCGSTFNLSKKPIYVLKDPAAAECNSTEPHKSYFGFSIILRKNSILIGAPKAILTPNGDETGGVYRCRFNESCHIYNMPYTNRNARRNKAISKNQMMGFSMDGSDSEEDNIIACAPNYVIQNPFKDIFMTGLCLVVDDTVKAQPTSSISALIPQIDTSGVTAKNSKVRFSQMGFSVQLLQMAMKTEFLIGAPGSFNWRGGVVSHLTTSASYNIKVANLGSAEVPENAYFGFAVTSARFESSAPDMLYYVSSAPQSQLANGDVRIFTLSREVTTRYILHGTQLGEFFGYALAADDFNGDALPDLAVSAPYHSLDKISDSGVVYIYKNLGNLLFSEPTILSSSTAGSGRFGLSLSKIGDIDGDGFNDIAVGAPFEDAGAVYIFHGSADGVDTKFSQRLVPPENDLIKPQWFGYYLSRGVDIDANSVNDLAVGAPNAEAVFIFKSYPVVKIVPKITIIDKATLDVDDTSLTVELCFSYRSKMFTNPLNLTLEYHYDSAMKRVQINTSALSVFSIDSAISCFEQNLTITPITTYDLTPIEFRVEYKPVKEIPCDSCDFCADCVAVDPRDTKSMRWFIGYSHGASEFNLTTELLNSNETLLLGTKTQLLMRFNVTNAGDRSFGTKLIVDISQGAFFELPENCQSAAKLCVICDIEADLKIKNMTTLDITIDTKKLVPPELYIIGKINTLGNYTANSTVYHTRTIELSEFSELDVVGESKEQQVTISRASNVEKIEHKYELTNNGPSRVWNSFLEVFFPVTHTLPSGKVINLFHVDNVTVIAKYNGRVKVITPETTLTAVLDTNSNCKENETLSAKGMCESNPVFKDLPHNRTSFINCFSNSTNCLKAKISLQHFDADGKTMNITLAFKIDPKIFDKILSNDRNFIVIESLLKLHNNSVDDKNNVTVTLAPMAVHTFIHTTRHLIGSTSIWVYIGSSIAAFIILCVITFFMLRRGFFQRPERDEMRKLMQNTTDLFTNLINMRID